MPSLGVALLTVLLAVAGLQMVAVAVPGAASQAQAAMVATGAGGEFVPVSERLLDTRTSPAGFSSPLTAAQWYPLQIEGAPGIPATGVSAVEVTLTAFAPASSGVVHVGPDGGPTSWTALLYDQGIHGTASNTAVVAVGADGKIKLNASSAIDMAVDVQGYYTAGDPTAGGYVPITPATIADTRSGLGLPAGPQAAGSTSVLQVGGVAGVPADASAVFLNLVAFNTTTSGGFVMPYPADGTRPAGASWFGASSNTSMGMTVALSSTAASAGKIKIYLAGTSTDLVAYVVGYYTATSGQGAFTPASTRVLNNYTIPANTTVQVPVAGVNGVPVAGSGITAAAVNVQVNHAGTAVGGALNIWSSDISVPSTNIVYYAPASERSNMANLAIGADGGVRLHNTSPDPVQVWIDVQGWYTDLADTVVVNHQNLTQRSVDLRGSTTGGGPWVDYRYRVGTTGNWTQLPASALTDTEGNHPASIPVTTSGDPAAFTTYTWNLAQTLGSGSTSTTTALVQVRACYGQTSDDPAPLCSMPNDITYAPGDFGDANATTDIGPGTLSLLTGDYEVSATDAAAATSVGGLSIGRSLTTLTPATGNTSADTTATGVFGPGWTADLSGPDAGEGDLSVGDQHTQGYLFFAGPAGWPAVYQATSSVTSYPITFSAVGDNAGDGSTVTMVSATKITMADADGTVTTWTKPGGTDSAWQVANVAEPGSNTTTTYTYNGAGLVTRILAPTPAGLSTTCTDANADTTPGCRSLVLNYTTIGGASRLTSVDASLPKTAGTANKTTVAAYDYDDTGHLTDAYDPRITPHLVTSYAYSAAGRLTKLTQPGQNAWNFGYTNGRLVRVSRSVPVTDPATGATTSQSAATTIVYGLPNSGTTGLPNLSAKSTATWGETSDLPIDGTATAVFSPDHQPASLDLASVGTADWPYATVHYLDVDGREVNTASYGAGDWQVDTSQYDSNGNDVWDLTAGNRAQALVPTSATDSYVAGLDTSAARADLLATSTVYNPLDASEATDSYGPTHPVTLSTGTVVHARTHSATVYDEGAPNSDVDPQTGTAYRLPTTTVTDPFDVQANNGAGADEPYPDAQTTRLGYAAVGSMSGNLPGVTDLNGKTVALNGWNLGQATTSTIQMGSSASSANDLTTTTVYDTDGRTVATWLPGDSTGTTPRATDTTYYTATGTGSCVSATAAGLACQTAPGGQPSTGAPLPTTAETYDQWGDPLTVTQTYGSTATSRTITNTYDNASRLLTSATAVAGAPADNSDLPKITNTYDQTTGLPVSSSTGTGDSAQALTTVYNSVGAVSSYTDATGSKTTTGYDIDGRPVRQTDTQGTTTLAYDSDGEHRGLVTGEDLTNTGQSAGESGFTASYDADGNLTTETYPGGITATSGYDNAGNPTTLAYATAGGAKLLGFAQTEGSTGTGADHVVAQSSTVNGSAYSDQKFTDDAAGRLVTVKDNLTATGAGSAAGCTTRQYVFDADSNRTKLTSYAPAGDGNCTAGSTATVTSYSYDGADRLTGGTNGAETYDVLGRVSLEPAGTAVGSGSHNTANGGPAGDLAVGYYSNDMVATQAQGSGTSATSVAFGLDPDQNRILTEATTTAAGVKTVTNHYDDDSDSPAWTSTAKVDGTTSTKRYLSGIDGGLAATVTDNGDGTGPSLKLDLTNLDGDTVATVDPTAGIVGYHETTEYGLPRDASAADDYGYLGVTQRSTDDLGGLTLMGVRLYNPATGRFLSVDPVYGGNANTYTYPDDPINGNDSSGNVSSITAPIQPPGSAFGNVPLGFVAGALTIAGIKIISATVKAYGHVVPFPSDKVSKSGNNYSVYTIWYYPDPKTHAREVWKYGMTGVGASRPESQLGKCSKYSRIRCNFTWVKEGGLSKWEARALEATLIAKYLRKYHDCPPGQRHRVCT